MKITLIGLGTRQSGWTLRAEHAIENAQKIMARSAFEGLENFDVETLDGVFKSSRNFDTLNKNLASAVIKASAVSPVCYCVDGAVCEDEACRIILKKHKDTEIIEGVPKSAYTAGLAGLECGQYTSVSAYGIDGLKSCRAAVVYDIDCEYIAGEVKLKLCKLFGDEADCTFVSGGKAVKIKVYEIDRQKEYSSECSLAVEEGQFLTKERYDYADIEKIIKPLRAPGGCP